MNEFLFTAGDGKKIVCSVWDDLENPKAVVQIVHGMNEHVMRYNRFAEFLNSHGYIVFGDDHRGHGRTATSIELIGKPDGESDLFNATIQDEIGITSMLSERYKLPVLLFAHSYGSFIAQRLMDISQEYKAVCLCGSNKFPAPFVQFVRLFAWICSKISSPEADAKCIQFFSFMRGVDWISRDKEQMEIFYKDPYRRDIFSYGFYHSLFKNLAEIRRRPESSLPVFIISGSDDVVGGNGRFVKALHKAYKKADVKDLSMKLYSGARHELLNELNYAEVQDDILTFFNGVLA